MESSRGSEGVSLFDLPYELQEESKIARANGYQEVDVCNRSWWQRHGRNGVDHRTPVAAPGWSRALPVRRAVQSTCTVERFLRTITSRQLRKHYWFETIQLSTAFRFTKVVKLFLSLTTIPSIASLVRTTTLLPFAKHRMPNTRKRESYKSSSTHADPRRVHQPSEASNRVSSEDHPELHKRNKRQPREVRVLYCKTWLKLSKKDFCGS